MKSIPQNAPVQLTFFDLLDQTTTVTCLVCGKKMRQIAPQHLKEHGLTCSDYKNMFPGVSLASQVLRDQNRATKTGKKRPKDVSTLRGITKNCEMCGKPFYAVPSEIRRGKAKFCSNRCKGKANTHIKGLRPKTIHAMCGADNPHWRGGCEKNYYGPNWKQQRRLARTRDNHICQKCGKTEQENGRKLDVHHIADFREFGLERYQEANQLDNLITLCRCCHSQITGRTTT